MSGPGLASFVWRYYRRFHIRVTRSSRCPAPDGPRGRGGRDRLLVTAGTYTCTVIGTTPVAGTNTGFWGVRNGRQRLVLLSAGPGAWLVYEAWAPPARARNRSPWAPLPRHYDHRCFCACPCPWAWLQRRKWAWNWIPRDRSVRVGRPIEPAVLAEARAWALLVAKEALAI